MRQKYHAAFRKAVQLLGYELRLRLRPVIEEFVEVPYLIKAR